MRVSRMIVWAAQAIADPEHGMEIAGDREKDTTAKRVGGPVG
jgi:hypothetical protein